MKNLTCAALFSAALISGALISAPAMADDLLATCKASPPSGAPEGQPADMNDKVCACIDKETASDEKVRAEFMDAFKEKDLAKRMTIGGEKTKSVAQKCSGNPA